MDSVLAGLLLAIIFLSLIGLLALIGKLFK